MANQQYSRGIEDMSGSREFQAMADSVLLIEEQKQGNYMLKQVKNRYASKCYAVNFSVEGNDGAIKVTYSGAVAERYTRLADQCEDALIKWHVVANITTFQTQDALDDMNILGFKRNAVYKAIGSLLGKRILRQNGRGNYAFV
jgi:hypothetical protein